MSLISVIIPVFDDVARLEKCLDSLKGQIGQVPFEVVVVDNASTDSPEQLVSKYDFAMYLFEATPGSYAARNAGIKAAKGDIFAFTDSDCIPAKDWLRNGSRRLNLSAGVDLIAGDIQMFPEDLGAPTLPECHEMVFGLDQEKMTQTGGAATANLFVRRRVFEGVGPFNSVTLSGGDIEFSRRATAGGYCLEFASDVVIMHPARKTAAELYLKIRRVVEGHRTLSATNSRWKSNFGMMGCIKDIGSIFKGAGVALTSELPISGRIKAAWFHMILKLYTVVYKIRSQKRL